MLQRQILSSNTALPKGEIPGHVWVKLSLHSWLYFSLPFLHTSPCPALVLNLPISFLLLCPILKWDLVVYLHMHFYLLTLRLCPVLKVSRTTGTLLVYQGIKTNGSSILSSRCSVLARGNIEQTHLPPPQNYGILWPARKHNRQKRGGNV